MKNNVLYIDIETAPSMGYYFDLWKEGNIVGKVREWYILSVAYKWEGEKSVKAMGLPDYPGYKKNKEDDKELVSLIHSLLSQADIVIAHNGDRFDVKKINARLLKHGITPPSPYKTVDTLKVAKKYFAMESNRLNDIAKYLKLGSKLSHSGFKLWEDCMAGDKKAWAIMLKYNKQDIVLLEAVYLKLRPWMTNHIDRNILNGTSRQCPNCGKDTLHNEGIRPTKTGIHIRYRCAGKGGCGAWTHLKAPKP